MSLSTRFIEINFVSRQFSVVGMIALSAFSWSFLPIVCGLTYLDHAIVEPNLPYANMSLAYTHNARGSAIMNFTFEFNVTVLKMLLYIKISVPENEHDSHYKKELLRTVIDVEKIFKESEATFMVKAVINNIRRFMDFKVKFPLLPVRPLLEVRHIQLRLSSNRGRTTSPTS